MSRIPDLDPVIVNANLNRRRTGVIPVNDGVDHGFPHGLPQHGEGLDGVDAIIGNQGSRVFRVQQVYRSVDPRE